MAREVEDFTVQTLGENSITVNVSGKTVLPFWNHDLKIKAAILLLSSVDYKDFANEGLSDLYFKLTNELKSSVEDLINL